MKKPLTNIQEILYTLIQKGNVSMFDFPYLAGYRTRVSELVRKHGLILEITTSKRFNKFGNSYTYHIHKLVHKDKAIELYNKMTKC